MGNIYSNQPIGIFDSGLGGLTVAKAVKQILPNESFIYFGDTFHLPYGDKSREAVQFYSKRISEFLLKKQCKAILIACNTASANAFDMVKSHVGKEAPVFDVINPVIDYIGKLDNISNVGVIATKGTINSKIYQERLYRKNANLHVKSLATPLLAPMIEEGFIFDDISNAIIRAYLSNEQLEKIDALILGCTHYPIIKNQISKYYNFKIDIIDSAQIVAQYVKKYLVNNSLLNTDHSPDHIFYVSDFTENFEVIARMFFESQIHLEKYSLWDK